MKKKKIELNQKLKDTLQRIGMSCPDTWQNTINKLLLKLELLNSLGKYDGLLKNLFSSNDKNGFNSHAFEAAFAYDFESNGQALRYEVKSLPGRMTSIDFLWRLGEANIFFELRVVNQRDSITKSINNQLAAKNSWQIINDGSDELDECIRTQEKILSKCQDKKGRPIKFYDEDNGYNFIVVSVSDLHLTMIDKWDCILAMYGDTRVPVDCRRGVFGLCEELCEDDNAERQEYHKKFAHFRDTIHGVLFVNRDSAYTDPTYFIDMKLQYFLVGNSSILEKEKCDEIINELASFLPPWKNKG